MNNPLFKLYLYGPFRLLREDSALTQFRGDKARALLAYLALQRGQPVPRQHLTALLWDGYPPASAKTSLRVALSNLRQLLGPEELLKSDYHTVQLPLAADSFWCDAWLLEQVLAPTNPQPAAVRWTEVQRLHQGELLAGFESLDSQPFRTWLYNRRTTIRQQIAQIRAQVVTPVGVPTNLTRTLTPLFGRQAEIRALQQRITNPLYPLVTVVGQGGVGKTRLALAVAHSLVERLTAGDDVAQGVTPSSKVDLSNYAELAHQFSDGIWFVGLADVIPTTLVAEQLAAAIGVALRFSFSNTGSLATQLRDYLREKALLLILDNFEQLQAGVPFLLALLQEARNLTLLITSRQPLNLQAEYVFTLRGLPVPDDITDQPSTVAGTVARGTQMLPSMQLFYERVRRVVTNFRPNQHTYADIAAICRLVNGLPLAIELAASQVRYRPCHEIRQALAVNYAALTTDLNDVPARHRSLQLVLDDSWRLLSPEEADVLVQCTLFQDGFTAEAALVITETTPQIFHWLEQKSFLQINQNGYYTMHSLVRQYASQMLHLATPEKMRAAEQRHSHYYLAVAGAQETVLQSAALQDAIMLLRQKLLNIRVAWRWAVAHEQLREVAQCSIALANFYQIAGLVPEGKADFTLAVEAMQTSLTQPSAASDPELAWAYAKLLCAYAQMLFFLGEDQGVITAAQQVIDCAESGRFSELAAVAHRYWAKALVRQGNPPAALEQLKMALPLATAAPLTLVEIQFEMGNWALSATQYDEATLWYDKALANSRAHQYRVMEVQVLQKLAALHHALADYAKVDLYGEAALQLAQQIGARHIENNLLGNLGIIWALRGDYATAQQYFKRALTAHRQSGNHIQQARTLSNLGAVASRVGDYAAAFTYAQKSQQMMQQLGDIEEQPSTVTNLALFAYHLGDYQTTLKYAQQGLSQSQQTYKRDKEAMAWTRLGDALSGLMQWNEAVTAYTQALEIAQTMALPHEAIHALAGLVEITLTQGGSRTECMAYVEEILAFHAQDSLMTLEEPFAVYLVCYQALAAYADPRADAFFHEAYQQLQSRAALISDEEMRHSFLTRIVAHQTLMTLAQTRI